MVCTAWLYIDYSMTGRASAKSEKGSPEPQDFPISEKQIEILLILLCIIDFLFYRN